MTAITPTSAHAYKFILLDEAHSRGPKSEISSAGCQGQYFPHLLCFVPQHAKEAMIFRCGPSTLTGVTRLADGETFAGWGAIARSPNGRIVFYVWSCHHHRG